MAAQSLGESISGGMVGLLIGDAVGVPYEFKSGAELPPMEQIDIVPPAGFRRSHPNAPTAAWSDDGAQAMCLLASLLEKKGLDATDFGQRLVAWLDSGYMAVGRVVFDVGNQTRRALSALRHGKTAEQVGLNTESYNGNGSLMRVLPLALFPYLSDEELVRDAAIQSTVTHPHVRSQVCCALYCLWARAELNGVAGSWNHATRTLRSLRGQDAAWMAELDDHIKPDAAPHGTGSGYVVECLNSARVALEEPTYERVIQRAVSLGHDTDTTAAVAGGIAGIRHGINGIPERWKEALAGRDLLDPLVTWLLASV
jgi:ADP-ribosylglycohydrolase